MDLPDLSGLSGWSGAIVVGGLLALFLLKKVFSEKTLKQKVEQVASDHQKKIMEHRKKLQSGDVLGAEEDMAELERSTRALSDLVRKKTRS